MGGDTPRAMGGDTPRARAGMHRGRGQACAEGAGRHAPRARAAIHRGRGQVYAEGERAYTAMARAGIRRGRRQVCAEGEAGVVRVRSPRVHSTQRRDGDSAQSASSSARPASQAPDGVCPQPARGVGARRGFVSARAPLAKTRGGGNENGGSVAATAEPPRATDARPGPGSFFSSPMAPSRRPDETRNPKVPAAKKHRVPKTFLRTNDSTRLGRTRPTDRPNPTRLDSNRDNHKRDDHGKSFAEASRFEVRWLGDHTGALGSPRREEEKKKKKKKKVKKTGARCRGPPCRGSAPSPSEGAAGRRAG